MLEKKIVFRVKGQKPTKFRYRGDERFGFKGSKVVEIVRFKKS